MKNIFQLKREKDLPFFIKLAKSMERMTTKSSWIIYDSFFSGLSYNPNLTRKQFLGLLPKIPSHVWKDVIHGYAASHLQKDNLKWIWEFAKEQDITDLSALYVGETILDQLDDDNDLRLEVIEYFKSLKEVMVYNKNLDAKQSIFSYGRFLEIMIEKETNMEIYDDYSKLLREYMQKEDEKDYRYYGALSENRHLDESRIRKLYDISKEYPESIRIHYFLNGLLQCTNVPEEIFYEMLEFRKHIKNKKEAYSIYLGAVKNPVYIDKIFDEIYNYLHKGFKISGNKDAVFRFLIANPSLTEDQFDKVTSILEKHIREGKIEPYPISCNLLSHIITEVLKKIKVKEKMKNVLHLYFDYLDRVNELAKPDPDKFFEYSTLPCIINMSKIHMDDEIYSLILDRTLNTVFEYQMFRGLLLNKDLNGKQYNEITEIFGAVYFNGKKLRFFDSHPSNDIRIPHLVLGSWASCKHVGN